MERIIDDFEPKNKKLKLMEDSIPTQTLPRTVLQDYINHKPLDFEFVCSDGSIHVSKLALHHSDFYNDLCKGLVCKHFIDRDDSMDFLEARS